MLTKPFTLQNGIEGRRFQELDNFLLMVVIWAAHRPSLQSSNFGKSEKSSPYLKPWLGGREKWGHEIDEG